uniref:F-box domain-containing protein n=1 Tax=Mycena chlorophos TaxID=658473 RepID=A0ABQ0M4I3_MYCCL|nr:predicted protein [Mycena chlorophos]
MSLSDELLFAILCPEGPGAPYCRIGAKAQVGQRARDFESFVSTAVLTHTHTHTTAHGPPPRRPMTRTTTQPPPGPVPSKGGKVRATASELRHDQSAKKVLRKQTEATRMLFPEYRTFDDKPPKRATMIKGKGPTPLIDQIYRPLVLESLDGYRDYYVYYIAASNADDPAKITLGDIKFAKRALPPKFVPEANVDVDSDGVFGCPYELIHEIFRSILDVRGRGQSSSRSLARATGHHTFERTSTAQERAFNARLPPVIQDTRLCRSPDELLSEILCPALRVSDEHFADKTSADIFKWRSPFANYSESTSAYLLVCKSWLRVATPLLYHVVVLRSKWQAKALANALEQNQALGRFIKKLHVEGGYGPPMETILRLSPNISDIFLTFEVYSPDTTEGLCAGLKHINPTRLILAERELKVLMNKMVLGLIKEVLRVIKEDWDRLRFFHPPNDWNCPERRVAFVAACKAAGKLETVVVADVDSALGSRDVFEGCSLEEIVIKEPVLKNHSQLPRLMNAFGAGKPHLKYTLVPEQNTLSIAPSLNPFFVPLGDAPKDVQDAIWSRILYWTMGVHDGPHWQGGYRSLRTRKTDLLCVSRQFHRVGLPHFYAHTTVRSNTHFAKLAQVMRQHPAVAPFSQSVSANPYFNDRTPGDEDAALLLFSQSLSIRELHLDHRSPHSRHSSSPSLPISWLAFTALAQYSASSLTRCFVEIRCLDSDPPVSPSAFEHLTTLDTLHWSSPASVKFAGAIDPKALPGLRELRVCLADVSFYQMLSCVELPSLSKLVYYDQAEAALPSPDFWAAHGSRLTELEVSGSRLSELSETVSILDLCPNLEVLIVVWISIPYPEHLDGTLSPTEPAASLAQLKLTATPFNYLEKPVLSQWGELFAQLSATSLPALREVAMTSVNWPTTERDISKNSWVRIAEKLLEKAEALARTLSGNKELGQFVKHLRVEGGYGLPMHTILRFSPNIEDLFLTLEIYSLDTTQGLCAGLKEINPTRLILAEHPSGAGQMHNMAVTKLVQALLHAIENKWDRLRVLHPPNWRTSASRQSQFSSAFKTANRLEQVVVYDLWGAIFAVHSRIGFQICDSLEEVVVQKPVQPSWLPQLIGEFDKKKPRPKYTILAHAFNFSYLPMESASREVQDSVWSRVLSFAMDRTIVPVYAPSNWRPRNLRLLLVSRQFHRVGLPHFYADVYLKTAKHTARLVNILNNNPSLRPHVHTIYGPMTTADFGRADAALRLEDPALSLFSQTPAIRRLDMNRVNPYVDNYKSRPVRISWAALCALAQNAGASLTHCFVVVGAADPESAGVSPSAFRDFRALEVLSWMSNVKFVGAADAQALPKLRELRLCEADPSFLVVLSSMDLPSLTTLTMYPGSGLPNNNFWTTHGPRITELEISAEMITSEEPRLLSLFPGLRLLCVVWTKYVEHEPAPLQESLLCDQPATALEHIRLEGPHFDGLDWAYMSEWEAFFADLPVDVLPALREISVSSIHWPLTERAIAQSMWVRAAERLLKQGVWMVDGGGDRWRSRMQSRKAIED